MTTARHRLQTNWQMILYAAAGLIGTAVLTGSIVAAVLAPGFDPLDLGEVQRIHEPERGDDGIPIIVWGDHVIVEGKKCNSHDAPITVEGRFWLAFKNPSGVERIVLGEGTDLRVPGCTWWRADPEGDCPRVAAECRQAFTNRLHDRPEVAAVIEALLADGLEPVVELAGEETPEGPGGVTRTWTTEVFRIVPSEAAP